MALLGRRLTRRWSCPACAVSPRGSILAARVESRRNTVSGRQLNADPLGGEMNLKSPFAASSLRALLLYIALYLPLAAVLGVVEGAIYGRWGLSSSDWAYQLGGFAVLLPWLLLAGVLAAPLARLLLSSVRPQTELTRHLWAAVCGPVAVFGAASLASGATGGAWWAPLLFIQLPVAFIGAAVLFGLLCARVGDLPSTS